MKSAHFNHKMIPLKNGDILIFDNQYDFHFSQSTEIFRVRKEVKNEWTECKNLCRNINSQ